jgi:hypothetical protein
VTRLYLLAGAGIGWLLTSCAALGETLTITNPETGEVTTTTVGDVLADGLVQSAEPAASTVSTLVGTATANPVIGAGAGAALLAAISAGAGALRRSKQGA